MAFFVYRATRRKAPKGVVFHATAVSTLVYRATVDGFEALGLVYHATKVSTPGALMAIDMPFVYHATNGPRQFQWSFVYRATILSSITQRGVAPIGSKSTFMSDIYVCAGAWRRFCNQTAPNIVSIVYRATLSRFLWITDAFSSIAQPGLVFRATPGSSIAQPRIRLSRNESAIFPSKINDLQTSNTRAVLTFSFLTALTRRLPSGPTALRPGASAGLTRAAHASQEAPKGGRIGPPTTSTYQRGLSAAHILQLNNDTPHRLVVNEPDLPRYTPTAYPRSKPLRKALTRLKPAVWRPGSNWAKIFRCGASKWADDCPLTNSSELTHG